MTYLLTLLVLLSCNQKKEDQKMFYEDSFTSQRHLMVESQIKSRGVSDENVLSAMKKVPRHKFVPNELQDEVILMILCRSEKTKQFHNRILLLT